MGANSKVDSNAAKTLYDRPLSSSRSGSLYCAFSYPTKISPESIALFIVTHTKPGDTIFDGFAGSGTTGLAALLCNNPPRSLRERAIRLGLNAKWGPRNAVLYELGVLGALVAQTLTNPPDPNAFSMAAEEILFDTEKSLGWMYGAKDPDGNEGTIRYTIWSDMLSCPACKHMVLFWDACVDFKPACIRSDFVCQKCFRRVRRSGIRRVTSTSTDDLLGTKRQLRERYPVRIFGVTDKKRWFRPPTDADMHVLRQIDSEPVPDTVPRVAIPWGDLYRRGYHTGISHVHHFYTKRNLIIFGRLWERTARYCRSLRDALRFWLLSYNASHATAMTRVVAKTGHDELVVTGAQPGVLYISGLPVEKNILDGLRRKMVTIAKGFETVHGRRSLVSVHERSSCSVDLPNASIDYVFMDPPFGGNIPYSELNFINEAWLGRYTDRRDEIIVSASQGKTATEYGDLLTAALAEVNRILKPEGRATVVFHSASAKIWNVLQSAYTKAGFGVENVGILNKTQGSFKQVTTAGAVMGDPVMLLSKRAGSNSKQAKLAWAVASDLLVATAHDPDPGEQTARRLYSRFVAYHITHNEQVPIDADVFYRWLAKRNALKVYANAEHQKM